MKTDALGFVAAALAGAAYVAVVLAEATDPFVMIAGRNGQTITEGVR